MVFVSQWMAEEVCSILRDMDIEGKLVQRKKYYVVYMKDGSMIVDFLNVIGAPLALMEMENVRIFKEARTRESPVWSLRTCCPTWEPPRTRSPWRRPFPARR